MKELLILLFLVFVILVSGCVDQETPILSGVSDGVVIKSFSFDSSTVYEEDPVGLNLEVQNVGEVKVTIEDVTLFGPDLSDWSSVTPPPMAPNIRGEELSASEPEVDFEGGMRYTRWRLTAPEVTAETTYTFGTRVVYKGVDYGTVYTGTLRVVTDTYLETLPEEERKSLLESSGIVSSSVTRGPLSVKPVKGRNFIAPEGELISSTVVFELNNVGSGYTSSDSNINEDTMHRVVILSSSGLSNCSSPDGTTVKLSKGKKRLFSCDFGTTLPIVNKEDIVFTIIFDYHYYVDGTTSITVASLPSV